MNGRTVRTCRRLDALRNVRARRYPSPVGRRGRGSRKIPIWAQARMIDRWLRVDARRRDDAALVAAAHKVADAVGLPPLPDPLDPGAAVVVVTLAALAATDRVAFRRELGRLRFLAGLAREGRTPHPLALRGVLDVTVAP